MTTELKPGTPEYDEAYQKEMQRLEAEAKAATRRTPRPTRRIPPRTRTSRKATKADDDKTETAGRDQGAAGKAERDLQAAQKAIKDTQRWGHKNAEEVKRLKKEAEDRKRHETAPEILKANPGLEDAIKHVAGARDEDAKPAPKERMARVVAKAIPDIETHLGDQAFFAKAKAKQPSTALSGTTLS
jgi:hypothetical protein